MLHTIKILGFDLPIKSRSAVFAEINWEQLKELIDSNRWKTEEWELPEGVDTLAVHMLHDEPVIFVSTVQEFRELVAELLMEIKFRAFWCDQYLQGKVLLNKVISLSKSDTFPEEFPTKTKRRIAYMEHPLTGKPVYAGYRPRVDWSKLPNNFTITFHLVGPIDPKQEKQIADDVRESFERWRNQ